MKQKRWIVFLLMAAALLALLPQPLRAGTETPGAEASQRPGQMEREKPGMAGTEMSGAETAQKPGQRETKEPRQVKTEKAGQSGMERLGQGDTQKPGQGDTQKPEQGDTQKPDKEEPDAFKRTNPPVITGYDSDMSRISKGNRVNITVSVRDTDFKTADGADLDVTKLVDSFSGGTVSVTVTSKDGEPLAYKVTFSSLSYSGTGNSLRFMVGYKGRDLAYETLELAVLEAAEYVEPEPSPAPTPTPLPQPMVFISRGDIPNPIQAGQELDVVITFENLSGIPLTSPIATFSVSDSLMLTGGSSSRQLEDIPAKGIRLLSVRVKALENISSSSQNLSVDLKYNYYNNVETVQGQASERLTIPAEPVKTEKAQQPTIIVTRSDLKPIEAKQKFELSIYIQNAGTVSIENVVMNVTTDTLLLRNRKSTFVIDSIEAGDTEEIALKLKAPKELSASSQSIGLELKYSYNSGEELVQVTASEHIAISSIPTEPKSTEKKPEPEKMDSAVPNVIIRTFDYGSESIAAGSSFPLNIVFVNTGKLAIENIVATVDGGESFTIAGGTNTFYYDRLGAGAEAQQLIQMQALATAKTGAQGMSISFKYEYVDGKKRAASSADIKLSIPVLQPERFQVDKPVPPEMVHAFEETVISMNYVNKGKGDISNVEASIEGNVQALTPTQFLGNFEPGKSGTINFIFTPMEPGETEVLLKISYEDASQEIHTKEFPVTLNVSEAYMPEYPEDYPMEEVPEQKDRKWMWIAGGAALFLILLIVIRVIRKKRAKKKQEAAWSEWDASWDEETAGPGPDTQPLTAEGTGQGTQPLTAEGTEAESASGGAGPEGAAVMSGSADAVRRAEPTDVSGRAMTEDTAGEAGPEGAAVMSGPAEAADGIGVRGASEMSGPADAAVEENMQREAGADV